MENNRKGSRTLEIPVCVRVHISGTRGSCLPAVPALPHLSRIRGWTLQESTCGLRSPAAASVSALRLELLTQHSPALLCTFCNPRCKVPALFAAPGAPSARRKPGSTVLGSLPVRPARPCARMVSVFLRLCRTQAVTHYRHNLCESGQAPNWIYQLFASRQWLV